MVKVSLHVFCAGIAILIAASALSAQTPTPFFMQAGAASRLVSGATSGPLDVGFARIQANSGSSEPDGFAIFGYRSNGILVSEAMVPEVPATTTGDRIFVEVGGGVNTGLAIANPNSEPATITFGFQDPAARSGIRELSTGTFVLPANSQLARFINEAPFNGPAPYVGLMSLQSSIPVAVTALRGFINERSEFLMTSVIQGEGLPADFNLPIKDITAGYIPQVAEGGGWSTELVLINLDRRELAFLTLQFVDASGAPLPVTINGQTGSSFDLSINQGDFLTIPLSDVGSDARVGYVRVIARSHSGQFSGLALYNFKQSGVTVTTASLPMVQPVASFDLYVDESGDFVGELRTGIAISNASSMGTSVSLQLMDLNGNPTGLTHTIQIPASGQVVRFLKEIPGFESVPFPFRGILRVTSSAPEGLTVAGLRGHLNERSEFLITSVLPTVVGNQTNQSTFLPHIIQGGGYSTEIVLLNGQTATASSGSVTSLSSTGIPLSLTVE